MPGRTRVQNLTSRPPTRVDRKSAVDVSRVDTIAAGWQERPGHSLWTCHLLARPGRNHRFVPAADRRGGHQALCNESSFRRPVSRLWPDTQRHERLTPAADRGLELPSVRVDYPSVLLHRCSLSLTDRQDSQTNRCVVSTQAPCALFHLHDVRFCISRFWLYAAGTCRCRDHRICQDQSLAGRHDPVFLSRCPLGLIPVQAARDLLPLHFLNRRIFCFRICTAEICGCGGHRIRDNLPEISP